MKNFYMFKNILLTVILLLFANNLLANGMEAENYLKSNKSISLSKQTLNSQGIQLTPDSKTDSLPTGVTQDWLSNLRDENGNPVINENQKSMIPEDPEGDAMQRKTFNGLAASGYFGYSVNNAGDVNGDGYDDIIIGANEYNTSTGRAYIYYGGISMNTVADVILTGEATANYFGTSVSSAGDVNGDGYSDVIVGAYGYNTSTGRAYIYYGGSSMNNAADVTMTGQSTGYQFGSSVSSSGDVNGDGYSDVIVGARGYGSNTGRAYIFYGGSSMNNVADVTMTGDAASNQFGYSVSSAGDVNGDGYSDVIAGAYGYNSNTGRAYIFYGGPFVDNTADVTMTGIATSNRFGTSVSSSGDVNGDGYSDVIIGASGYSSNTGRAYIFYGGASMDNAADVTMTGEAIGNYFGYSTSSGDVNADGYSDVVVGAYGYSGQTGRAYIFFGGFSMNNIAEVTMTGEAANNQFGYSVSSAGDVNSDGYTDVIAGAYGNNLTTGRAYLFDYFMKGDMIPDLNMTGAASNILFGVSVSSAGDVNGDGYSDVIVGANGFNSNTGKAYIFYGGAFADNVADVTMTGEATGNFLGRSVSSAGDVNGDGYSDVIVGANGYSSNTGRAYIFLGGAAMDNVADITMTGATANIDFGYSVSSAGDVNGDGYADVIVGADGYSTNTGRAYVFYGGTSMNNTADVTMTGEGLLYYFGYSVSSAGDVNGDGYADVIVGSYQYSSSTGRAYVYYGGSTMDNTADVTMTGEGVNNAFGYSVSSAGDVNGDGYSDVIVGAYQYGSFKGRAYIFFGSTSVDNVADVTMTGETVSSNFGYSVSSAGDVNSDGYSDIIVGSSGYNSNTGTAYIFFGGLSINNVADIIMTGESANNYFGASVSSAGDINGDGYVDEIVGAYGYVTNAGRSYLYYGSAISVKPVLNFVKDVPNDQGGYINLKFSKSGFDVLNSQTGGINYQIERSVPPGSQGYQWISVGTVLGTFRSFYLAEVHTPADSGGSGNNTFFFRVTAVSNLTGEFWRSNITSGYSLDNIAPSMVTPFTASAAGSNVSLNWGQNSAPDFLNYILYRNISPIIDPNTEPVFATTTNLNYLDTSPLSGNYYYFIVAQDIHHNKSPVNVVTRPNITINLTMFIEGFYDAGTDSQVSDTIKAYLRNSNSPYVKVDSATAIVNSIGNAVLYFTNAPAGNYYIELTHRNIIETWSSSGISMTTGSPVNYDFSNASAQAYGNNEILIDASPVRYGIFSGDPNQNGYIDLADINLVYNGAVNFVTGYVVTDVTGDEIVDLSDLTLVYNNSSNFVIAVTP